MRIYGCNPFIKKKNDFIDDIIIFLFLVQFVFKENFH